MPWRPSPTKSGHRGPIRRWHPPGQIAERVATGRSNREVAAELFVTARTVEANLTRIYAKVGVRSRGELAARRGEW